MAFHRARRSVQSLVLCGTLALTAPASAQCTGHWIPGDPLVNVSGPVGAVQEFDFGDGEPKLVVGGQFSAVGDTFASNIAAWDGQRWGPIGEGFGGSVRAFTVFRGELIAAGHFGTSGDEQVSRIARWDGHAWRPLGAGVNSFIESLVVYRDELVVGGSFGGAGGMAARFIAKWDGDSWSTLGTGMNGPVTSMCVSGDDLIVSGVFTTAGDQPALRAARRDGDSWHALGTGLPASAASLLALNGCVYAGGTFSAGGGQSDPVLCWDGASWASISSELMSDARSLLAYEGELVACGTVRFEGSGEAGGVMTWNGKAWQYLGSNRPQQGALCLFRGSLVAGSGGASNYDVRSLVDGAWVSLGEPQWEGMPRAFVEFEGDLVAAGTFSLAGGVPANGVARLANDQWIPFGEGLGELFEPEMVVHAGELVVGSGQSVHAWNGNAWRQLGADLPRSFSSIASHAGDLHAGTGDGIFRFDGKSWVELSRFGYTWMEVDALAEFEGELYAGGEFRRSDGATRRLLKWNGSVWQDVGGGVTGDVRVLLTYNGELMVGGNFDVRIGSTSGALLAWDGKQARRLASGSWIDALTVYRGDLIAFGAVRIPDSVEIARFNGTAWREIPSARPSSASGVIRCIQGVGNTLAVGGTIQVIEGVLSNRVARWRDEVGDFDGDGFITGADLDAYVVAFESGAAPADTNEDGFINGMDFDRFVQAFEAGCV